MENGEKKEEGLLGTWIVTVLIVGCIIAYIVLSVSKDFGIEKSATVISVGSIIAFMALIFDVWKSYYARKSAKSANDNAEKANANAKEANDTARKANIIAVEANNIAKDNIKKVERITDAKVQEYLSFYESFKSLKSILKSITDILERGSFDIIDERKMLLDKYTIIRAQIEERLDDTGSISDIKKDVHLLAKQPIEDCTLELLKDSAESLWKQLENVKNGEVV